MTILRLSTVFCLMALAACSGSSVKDTLGLNRKAPDEFRVVSRPPLSVPPQFSLRPPSASDESPIATPARKQAESLILGNEPAQPEGQTYSLVPGNAPSAVAPVTSGPIGGGIELPAKNAAEAQFLMNAGADKADPAVRNTLAEEKNTMQIQEEEAAWWEVWSTNPTKKDPTVNAKGEAERIKKNEEEGKPVTEGETPEIKGRDRGILGRILGD